MSLNELNRWREWAQFVYLGGGPVILTDEVLRNAVCQTHDSDVQDMKMERAKLLKAFENLVESVSERHHWSQFAGTDLVVPKDAFEDARAILASLKAKP